MSEEFRIATYNIENFDDSGGEESFAARLAGLRPMLAAMDADVVCLQEVDAQPHAHAPRKLRALDRLLEGTPYAGYAVACSEPEAGHGPADRHNLVVLSRYEVLAARSIRHELLPPPVHGLPVAADTAYGRAEAGTVAWDRPLLHVTLALPEGRRLEVVNLHLRAPLASHFEGATIASQVWRGTREWAEGFYLAGLKRMGQALEARLLVERLFDADRHALIVVAGDLNAGNLEMPLRLLRADVADTRNELTAYRRLEPAESRVPAERAYTALLDGRRVMLDHLLLSPALLERLQAVEVLNDGLMDEAAAARSGQTAAASYHAPLVAQLAF